MALFLFRTSSTPRDQVWCMPVENSYRQVPHCTSHPSKCPGGEQCALVWPPRSSPWRKSSKAERICRPERVAHAHAAKITRGSTPVSSHRGELDKLGKPLLQS